MYATLFIATTIAMILIVIVSANDFKE
jgi:hypothetical protein